MKRIILCLVIIIGALTITGCSNKATENESNKSIIISDVDKGTRWEAITNYEITLEFKDGKCVSENYRLEFLKESNIEDYKQEGNIVTYKRTGINNEFYDRTIDEAYDIAKKLYSSATITKK